MALGKNVKKLREAKGMDQLTLSRLSGVPVGTISALEVRDSVRSQFAAQLAKALGVSTDELIEDDSDVIQKSELDTEISSIAITDAEAIEVISNKLSALTEEQRKDMSVKLAALALAPDSQILKITIIELLGYTSKNTRQRTRKI